MSSTNNTAPPLPPTPGVDQVLGCVSLLCILLGTPLNLLSFFMFKKQKRTATFTVHMVIAATDTWISFNAYPLCMTMLSGSRDPLLFNTVWFQTVWGVTWEPFVYLSIYLVLVISVLRSIKLVRRLGIIPLTYVYISIGSYASFLIIRITVVLIFFGSFTLPPNSIYPFIIMDEQFPPIDLYIAIICLALPFFPIIASALVSTAVLKSRQQHSTKAKTKKMKNQATVTVLLFTLVYVVCNFPILLACIWFSILLATGHNIFLPGSKVFLDHYIWPLTYVVLVQLNAAINPFIYLIRMTWFRASVAELLGQGRIHFPTATAFMRESTRSEESPRRTVRGNNQSKNAVKDIGVSLKCKDSAETNNAVVLQPIDVVNNDLVIENNGIFVKRNGVIIENDPLIAMDDDLNVNQTCTVLTNPVSVNGISATVM